MRFSISFIVGGFTLLLLVATAVGQTVGTDDLVKLTADKGFLQVLHGGRSVLVEGQDSVKMERALKLFGAARRVGVGSITGKLEELGLMGDAQQTEKWDFY